MYNIIMPTKCNFIDCNKSASFNISGLKPKFCSIHKTDEMINVKHGRCIFNECLKIPYFNYLNSKKGLYCGDHKLENMINIKSPRCKSCDKIASYNLISLKTPEYCNEHKTEKMHDVTHKKCKNDKCKKIPIYNYENEITGLYCSEHKLENMINIISKRCIFDNCTTLPFYNYINCKNGLYCNKHKLQDMIDVKSKRCLFNNCIHRPIYNYINEKNGIYCKDHKLENMIDIVNKRFKSNFCYIMINNKKYNVYCIHCYVHLFPENQISTNYKTKENEVKKFILDNYQDKKWICDKIIENGLSKRRPDFLLELQDQFIIIEVDENQHIKYDCTCENKRLMEISKDLNYKNIVFIRFNPDNYINNNNQNIDSCWKINTNGTLSITNINLWNERLKCLSEQINYWCNNKTNKTIEIIQLYYDGFLL